MIRLTIDGQSVEVAEGTTVLQATRQLGIDIPTLCDHPALEPYGGCRLCVVEIEGFRTLQASCTLPASEGMVVHTATPKVEASRHFVLSMIFSERNHFCMYCQKTNGDCELQNAAYGEDMTYWPIQPNWTPFQVDASSPHFIFDHNRCILCRRCVRACGELVGNFTLGMENRGARTMIVADYGLPVGESTCIRCGSCVQICPTGALIDRRSAYIGNDRTTERVSSICTGCSVGCGIEILTRDNRLVRIDGDWEAPVNGGLLCELGRYLPLDEDRKRITRPMVRKNGTLIPASWDEAVAVIGERLAPLAGRAEGGIAALASTRMPAEALYAYRQLFSQGLRTPMTAGIEEDFTTATLNGAGPDGDLDSLKHAGCVVVIGADLANNHQVAGFLVKRQRPNGTRIIVIDPQENALDEISDYSLRIKPGSDAELLRGMMAAVRGLGLGKEASASTAYAEAVKQASQASGIPLETVMAASRAIAMAEKPVIVYGKGVTKSGSPQTYETLRELAGLLNDAPLINVKGKANSLAGHAYQLDRAFDPRGSQAVYLALGDDEPTPRMAERLVGTPFLAVQASYASELTEQADVVLPVETWAEQEGHFLNLEGRLQKANKAVAAPTGVRSNLAALKLIANCLEIELGADEWKDEILRRVPQAAQLQS